LHRGEQLLFAAVPQTGTEYPTALRAPRHATAGHAFNVKVVWFNASGKRNALPHAHVTGSGISATTDAHGIARITPGHSGVLVLKADEKGYIRSAPLRVTVSG
jgi:hypothetical protein